VIALDESTARLAAELRARHGGRLELPDALVVATAHALDVDVLVTSDRGWPSRSRLGLRAEVRRL
jgi:predicted nucleic acid-binding protein